MKSPVSAATAIVGLLLLLPTTIMLFRGDLTAVDAGLRAMVILVIVRVLDRWLTKGLRSAAKVAARSSSRGYVLTAEQVALLNPPVQDEYDEDEG